MRPKIFIASSTGAKEFANEVRIQLNDVADVNCWWDPTIFRNGRPTIDDLLRVAREFDLGVFIFNNDDSGRVNGEEVWITRDNVLFEYGLFVAEKSAEMSFLFFPADLKNFRMATDLKGITFIPYMTDRNPEYAAQVGVNEIKKKVRDWAELRLKAEKNICFSRFSRDEEPPVGNGFPIDFKRSFNLLLYMFGKEKFAEFRALDLAFNRWEEAFRGNGETQSQITNYSNEIIHTVKHLFESGRCTNFRRILVIPRLTISAEVTKVLQVIHDSETEAVDLRKRTVSIRNRKNNGKHTPHRQEGREIIETRIMLVGPSDFYVEFRNYNDFAQFTDELTEFAIVEKTLSSPHPMPRLIEPQCVVETDHGKLQHRKEAFDMLWDNHAIPIKDFLKTAIKKDTNNTVWKAYKYFIDTYGNRENILSNISVVVETAYVELMKIGDVKRQDHYARAVELMNLLDALSWLKGNMFVDTFINDFKPRKEIDTDCKGFFCEIGDLNDPEKFRELRQEVTRELTSKNLSLDLKEDCVATFYMTKTRESAIRTVQGAMVNPSKRSNFLFEQRGDKTEDVILKINNQKINLGYKKGKSVVSNCALLMAEHYFKLFQFAYSKNPQHKEFWIFDFLINSEMKAVEEGALAGSFLQNWPTGITLHIINCCYNDDGRHGEIRPLGPFKF